MRIIPWGLLVIALVLGYGWHRERVGELNGKIAHLERSRQRADSTYRVEVSEMANQVIHYKNLRRVIRLTDTVWVKRFVVATDSAIASCTRAVEACDHRVAIRDSIIAVLKKKPSVWSKLPWVAAGVLGGVILSK
jgi:hypothetical protein